MHQPGTIDLALPGNPIEASQWNLIRSAILSILGEFPGLGQTLDGHLPSSADMFRIKSSNGDYWTCRRYDGTDEGDTDYLIAKPFELRPSVTALGTQTYSYSADNARAATDGPDSEDQEVIPPWVVNESVIWAAFADNVGVTSDAGARIDWIDLNTAARAWGKSAA